MLNTMDVAIDLAKGQLDVCDLVDNEIFLYEVDNTLKHLFEKDLFSGVQIARKRKQIFDKITSIHERS